MLKNFIHPIKYSFKVALKNPLQLMTELSTDINKDISAKNYNSPHKLVWCAGLPKSGTTMVEKILNDMPYVQVNMSPIRRYSETGIVHPHDICEDMFRYLPKNKYSFLKTHTHYKDTFLELSKKYNARIIVSLRDLRDMLISNYFHIMSNPKQWEYDELKHLNTKEGFKRSLILSNDKISSQTIIEYYYYWIKNWMTVARDNNLLVLWFEDYKKDPLNYISNIINYLEFQQFDAQKIEENLSLLRLNQAGELSKNLNNVGKKISTYNINGRSSYLNFFDDDINNFFNNNLPEPLESILR